MKLKNDFLNWSPDQDEYKNPLITADNAVHDTEGYKKIYLNSGGAFNTHIAATESVLSVVAKQGVFPPLAFAALIEEADFTTPSLQFGILANTTLPLAYGQWATTGYPDAHRFATAGASGHAVVAFDVCYLGDKAFMVAVAEQSVVGALATVTTETVAALGVGTNFVT